MIPRYEPTFTFSDLWTSLIATDDGIAQSFAERLRAIFSVKHVFLVNSGKTGLYLLLKAIGKPGGVLMPAYNCNVVPEAAVYAGYKPVLVDVDLQTMNMPEDDLEKYLTDEISVIFAIHLFGIPCDIPKIIEIARKKNILVVEDVAPAMGAAIGQRLVGTFGDVSVISFQSTKPISGETGGAILTNDDALAENLTRVMSIQTNKENRWGIFFSAFGKKLLTKRSVYPLTKKFHKFFKGESMYEVLDTSSTLPMNYLRGWSPFSTNLVNLQLDRFSSNLERRRWIASRYQEALKDHPDFQIPRMPEYSQPAWTQYPMLVKNKRDFYIYMQKNGIDITWSYRYSCADMYRLQGFPNAEKVARSILSLPVYPALKNEEVEFICQIARGYSPGSKTEGGKDER